MKILSLLIISLLLCGATYAQSNYKKGYIITAATDTLRGFIDHQEWVKSPVNINFKQQKDSKDFKTYTADNISKFKVEGAEEYVSFKGNISADEIFYPNLPVTLDTSVVYKTVFIEKVTPGKGVALYYHRDAIRHRFFIQDEDGPVQELIYHEYYNNDKSKVLKDQKYKQQLTLLIGKYLQNNGKLIDKLDNVAYDEADLKQLINKLNFNNGTANTPTEVNGDSAVSKFSFFAGIGVNYAKMEVKGDLDLSKAAASNSYSPLVYAGVNFFPHKKTRRLAIQAEISAWNSSHEFITPSSYSDFSPVYKGALDKWSVKRFNISVAPQILYNFYNRDNFKIYAAAGIAINISTFDNEHILTDPQTNKIYLNLNEIPLKKTWVNFPLKAGTIIGNKVDVSFKYSPSTNLSSYQTSSVSGHIISLGAAYVF